MIDELINAIENYTFIFIDQQFKMDVLKYLKYLMPLLNSYDMNIIHYLTLVLIEEISIRYNFNKDIGYRQWTKNNGRDIASLSLTLIPYIGGPNDKNYDLIENLKDIIYKSSSNSETISTEILELNRKDALNKYFPYSNFTLGLLNQNKNIIYNLYEKNQHTIYHCIENNFLSMMETIKITNGKLFINWINVIPTHNYKNTFMYNTSRKELETIENLINKPITQNIIDNVFNVLKTNKGLWLGDYYNVFTNAYFYSIKKIKWFIFCKKIPTNEYFYMIQYLNKLINLNSLFQNSDYNSLTDIDRINFNNKYNNFYNNLKNNIVSFKDLNFEFDIAKNILSFLSNNYSKMELLDSEITYIFNEVEVVDSGYDLDPVDIQINKISNKKLLESMKFLTPEILWDYLKESMVVLQTTPYAKYLIKKNSFNELEINMDFFNLDVGNNNNARINLKNVYNICKTICHETIDDKYILLGTNFKSLNEHYAFRYFILFLNKEILKTLDIRRNIRIQEVDNYNFNNVMEEIQNGWDIIKVDLVWDYLNENGLLSTFNINLEITDNDLMQISDVNIKNKKIQNGLKKFFQNNKHLFDCNYFLTNEPYNKLKKNTGNGYMDILTEKLINYTFYANDWVSQLNFFNHYINHSIMYVTGSTGTGKSTQVPKLV
jgi:hypothetical protein